MSAYKWTAFNWYGLVHHPLPVIQMSRDLAAHTLDVTGGLSVCLEMLEHDELEQTNDKPERLFNDYQRGCVMRLCIASLQQLNHQASHTVERLNKVR